MSLPHPLLITGRALVFTVLAAGIVGGPGYRQVLHGRNEYLRPWEMFSGAGLNATQVVFKQRAADGTESVLDRYAMLSGGERRVQLTKVPNEAAATRIAQRLCAKLGTDADVRVYLRIATRRGWKRALKGDVNECAAGLRAPVGRTESEPEAASPGSGVD